MDNGATVVLSSFGATILKIFIPNSNGQMDDCVIGFDQIEDYAKGVMKNFGIVGRVGNRIKDSKFTIDGVET